ncbi:MAG: hypothetical protein OFPI_09630 [Osedax symbiont Rs2]|nr:MAG: hypothetical protein OFPI_09630 [Osedax symbiont Rs2]
MELFYGVLPANIQSKTSVAWKKMSLNWRLTCSCNSLGCSG